MSDPPLRPQDEKMVTFLLYVSFDFNMFGAQIGSGTLPTQPTCLGADQRRPGNIMFGQTEHLSLHELEAGDLPLGLAI
ncbi:hypothetical protein [Methylorubrum thiocyanatum]|uniref:hypothetical protein n=1 Tax=Methylorubrum thiocyanatum TaxID=47958 RepID=UPI0036522D75